MVCIQNALLQIRQVVASTFVGAWLLPIAVPDTAIGFHILLCMCIIKTNILYPLKT
ncbi:hypothetical protein V8C42DRAFT_338035 [Trichoderma barbatum]